MRLAAALADLIYPPRCISCRRKGAWLCDACLVPSLIDPAAVCPRCSHSHNHHGLTCDFEQVRSVRAAFAYSAGVRLLTLSLKYQGQAGAAAWMAGRMAGLVGPERTTLVPVPMHPARERERGFNQARLLARELGRARGLPVLDLLERSRFRRPQERLTATERVENVRGDFRVRAGVAVPEHVTLVDDVCTTGATLEECARVLRSAGAAELHAVVFARAGERW